MTRLPTILRSSHRFEHRDAGLVHEREEVAKRARMIFCRIGPTTGRRSFALSHRYWTRVLRDRNMPTMAAMIGMPKMSGHHR